MPGIILPQILNVKLTGYEPLFAKPVEIVIPSTPGPLLIVGGNGLGKTSILQSVIFGIVGGADDDIYKLREDKPWRWDHTYFTERVAEPKKAEVRVTFKIGETEFEVRRGLDSSKVRGFRKNNEITNSTAAGAKYEQEITNLSGCASFNDFRTLIHRLSYLPEHRRNLIWDSEGQLTVTLLICGEQEAGAEVSSAMQKWRDADTAMRHTHSSITNVLKKIADVQSKTVTKKKNSDPVKRNEDDLKRFEQAKMNLSLTNGEIEKVAISIQQTSDNLEKICAEIENEEEFLNAAEDNYIVGCLQKNERAEATLALQKLLVYSQCPYCTQKAPILTVAATRNVNGGLCPICGQNHGTSVKSKDLIDKQFELAEKTRRRATLQKELRIADTILKQLKNSRRTQEATLESLSAILPRIRASDPKVGVMSDDPAQLEQMLAAYQATHAREEAKAMQLQNELREMYARVAQANAAKFSAIQNRVAKYASEFLGTDCTFDSIKSDVVDKQTSFTFSVLVPSFNGRQRKAANQCSESQAFFLDIAFRMAVIDLARELSGYGGTFVCETPENSLDLAYADNVAEMFQVFTEAKCYSIMTANLQAGGVAQPLLKKSKTVSERKRRAFNLLEHANLSEVQCTKRSELNEQFSKLIDG